jgi:hypothetical protein
MHNVHNLHNGNGAIFPFKSLHHKPLSAMFSRKQTIAEPA